MDEFEVVREELFRFHLGFNWRKGAAVEVWVHVSLVGCVQRVFITRSMFENTGG